MDILKPKEKQLPVIKGTIQHWTINGPLRRLLICRAKLRQLMLTLSGTKEICLAFWDVATLSGASFLTLMCDKLYVLLVVLFIITSEQRKTKLSRNSLRIVILKQNLSCWSFVQMINYRTTKLNIFSLICRRCFKNLRKHKIFFSISLVFLAYLTQASKVAC